MYSNSNSYLGGGAGLRPGQQQQQPQYGTASPFGQPQQQQQQQPSPFAPQPTGFGQAPLQSQYTGFPGMQPQATGMPQPQLQAQYTGFPGGGFQSSAAPPMPSIPAQFQQQNQQQQQPPLPSLPQQSSSPFSSGPSQGLAPPAVPMKPQPTGFQEMAASFHTGGGAAARASAAQAAKPSSKIPNIRLSFITAQDQAKFETLFKSAVGDGQTTMSGEKARDLLLRSRLDGDSLSQIWTLADTTRSGQLHFPEFALAMYLCNLKLTGKTLPSTLPANIKNEVSSMVDIINFSIEDDNAGGAQSATNAPDFSGRQTTASPPAIQHPQPQPSNSQLLQATMTGFPGQQQQQQQPGFLSQPTGFQPQPTGFQGLQQNPQAAGYSGPRPAMPPMPTGFAGAQGGMAAPLNAQPTGRPGQWGLVNTPSTGLPNIDILQQRMMPQTGRDQGNAGGFTTAGLQGNAQIPWAITKGEKTTYDAIFRAWDGMNKGYIAGSQAIEIFGQSGLEKPDLERVWTLADHGNKGRLNLDEFAVAMHLIYRKLNGYPVPARLPAELVPPSTRNFSESLDTLKNLVNQESDHRKNSGAALLPQKTGVSYLKSHSFRGSGGAFGSNRKDGTVFKNDDEAVSYKSSARRRLGGGNESPRPDSPSSVTSNDDLTLDQLRKKLREKQVVLDALDFSDEKNAEEDEILDRKDRREADELYRRIRRIQEDIDSHPNASLVSTSGNSDAERRTLKRQLQTFTDKIPSLASQVRKTEKAIADARLELFRIKDAKANPSSAEPIVGTGPGGAVTESDRVKARAKAMMRQRTAALRGEKVEASDNGADAARRLEEESSKVRNEKENNERMVQDVEDSVREFAAGIEDSIKDTGDTSTSEHERRRWEDALGVEDEVRDFIFDLQRSSRSNRVRAQDRRSEARTGADSGSYSGSPSTSRVESPVSSSRTATPTAAAGGSSSYSAYKTPEERAAYIKEQAAQRMQERLAAIGISRRGESPAQRAERERAERAEKARLADEETARRDAERKARLAEEQGIPPPAAAAPTPAAEPKQAPPPPAVRKAAPRAEEQLEQQQAETKEIESSAKADEDELTTAAQRLKDLEEQVRQGKIKKEEEKKKKKAALAEAKEKEARLAARRAEIEAAKKREEELRRQLEAMDDDSDSSDDDEGPQQITPQASTPAMSSSQISNDRDVTPSVAVPPVPTSNGNATSPEDNTKPESRNPYFKMLSQSSGSSSVATPPASTSASDASTNPFHRMTANPIVSVSSPGPAPAPTGPISRKRADTDDGWGSDANDDDDEDSDDDDRPGGKSAAELASRLFGSMAPPRPLSAVGDKNTSASPASVSSPTVPPPPPVAAPEVPPPAPAAEAPAAPEATAAYDAPAFAPPPPPVPSFDAPSAPHPPPPPAPTGDAPAAPGAPPPPPPPPPPPGGAPGAPPPPPPPPPPGPPPPAAGGGAGMRPAAFLSQVKTGMTLKKTVTNDKSAPASGGRVLD